MNDENLVAQSGWREPRELGFVSWPWEGLLAPRRVGGGKHRGRKAKPQRGTAASAESCSRKPGSRQGVLSPAPPSSNLCSCPCPGPLKVPALFLPLTYPSTPILETHTQQRHSDTSSSLAPHGPAHAALGQHHRKGHLGQGVPRSKPDAPVREGVTGPQHFCRAESPITATLKVPAA